MKFHAFLRDNPGWLPFQIFCLLLIAMVGEVKAQAPVLTFTVETATSDGRSITPRLTWTTTPAAQGCSGTGGTGWAGTGKAASGTQLLAPITVTTSYSITCTWPGDLTARVNWTAPTTNTDGTPYTNPGGFRIQYGTAANALNTSTYLTDPAVRTWTSPALTAGPWFFAVRAVNTNGIESDLSNIATKTIVAAASQSRTLEVAVKFPNAPTGVTVE